VLRFEFQDVPGANFAGIYLLNGILPNGASAPLPNFGTVADAGFDLSGATTLRFWARGQTGGEEIEFFVAGVGWNPATVMPVEPFPDSSPRHPGPGTITTLTSDWQRYEIDVSGLDLSYVLGGFGWVTNDSQNPGGAVFFLDDIEYLLSPEATAARLDLPRFLTSYLTLPVQPDPFDGNPDDDIDLVLRNMAFSYDNALALLAFLADGSPEGLRRARLLGDAFVYAAGNDRFFSDGRIRSGYAAGDISLPPGWVPNGRAGTVPVPGFFDEDSQQFFEVGQEAVDVGNNSWVMTALLALYRKTGDARYLVAARDIGAFIRTCRADAGTFQGFQGGIGDPEGTPVRRPWASAEHNLDVHAAFREMAAITGEPGWLDDADHARTFLEAMWDAGTGCYLAGTLDPDNRNEMPGQLPLDVQAWSVLARPDDALQVHPDLLDCPETHHRTVDAGLSGFDFNDDRDGVWFEGTAQMALARLAARNTRAWADLLTVLQEAQQGPDFGDGEGIVSATVEGLTTGFDFRYFRRRHIAVAAWNVFAQGAYNPYYQRRYLVFRDGFESGDTSRWALEIP